MSRSPTPLIARLRRRLVTSVWLFALLVLVKSTFATACLTDGLATSDKVSVSVSDRAADTATTAIASPTVDDDATQAGCWDSASGNCHCACAHASPMSLMHTGWSVGTVAMHHAAWRDQRHDAAPRSTTLRPPIRC
jgi:hypothetical protein